MAQTPPPQVVLYTIADLHNFLNRPRLPERDLPPFEAHNPFEEALRWAVVEPARGKVALQQALLMEPLYVPILPRSGGTLDDLRIRHEPHRIAKRQDRAVPLFSSRWRPYDGLSVWPLPPWSLPLTGARGSLVLADLTGVDFVINPFSRYSRRLPAREAADLLAGRLAPLPTGSNERESFAIRALPSLPPGFADELRAYCRTQPSIISAYAAEWDVPPGDPAGGLVIVLVSFAPEQLRMHSAMPLVARYFRGTRLAKATFMPLDPVPAPGYDGEKTLHQHLRFMQPLYVVGGAQRPPMMGPLTGVTD